VGPLFAVAADESVPQGSRVDPHHWADQVCEHGFLLQLQPAFAQEDGSRLPSTTHLTITPVTEAALPELTAALATAADEVRGVPAVSAADVLAAFPPEVLAALSAPDAAPLDSETAFALLASIGLAPGGAGGASGSRGADTAGGSSGAGDAGGSSGAGDSGGSGRSRGADAVAVLPDRLAPFLALVEALSAPLTERLLTELLARLVEPDKLAE
jgi:hypothetical protein